MGLANVGRLRLMGCGMPWGRYRSGISATRCRIVSSSSSRNGMGRGCSFDLFYDRDGIERLNDASEVDQQIVLQCQRPNRGVCLE